MISLFFAMAAPPAADPSEYGAPVSYADGVRIGEEFVKNDLRDPDSAEFKWPNDFVPFTGSKRATGYATCFSYNAKNSFGGYVGYLTYRIVIRDGKVVDYMSVSPLRIVPDICKELSVKFGMRPISAR